MGYYRKVNRNIVKDLPAGQLFSVAVNNATRYNEVWYWMPEGQMAVNAKGRRGYEQYSAVACHPDGRQEVIREVIS